MSDSDYYQTLEQIAIAEFKDSGSKFITHAYPVQYVENCKNW